MDIEGVGMLSFSLRRRQIWPNQQQDLSFSLGLK
jgi:hypothetical protein